MINNLINLEKKFKFNKIKRFNSINILKDCVKNYYYKDKKNKDYKHVKTFERKIYSQSHFLKFIKFIKKSKLINENDKILISKSKTNIKNENIINILNKYLIYYPKYEVFDNFIKKLMNRFVSFDILLDVEKNLNKVSIYNSNNINITIIHKNKINKKLIKNIFNRIYLMIELSDKQISQEINIVIFLSNNKKKINNGIVGSLNANSGSTSFFMNHYSEIVIWRKEELQKVLLHELIHLLFLDYKFEIENNVKSIFNINKNTNILLNEAYTETFANLINIIIVSIENKKDLQNLLETEIHFSLFQTSKILKHYKFKCIKDCKKGFIKTKENEIKLFEQNTSIFSYYIVKSMFLYNYNLFIKYLVNYNIDLFKTSSNKNFLNKLLQKCLLNESYINEINRLLKFFNKITGKHFKKNLRMTIIE